VGLTWLVNCASAMLMPDINPTADIFVFSLKAYWHPCGADLARQLRLGDVDAGHNPTADIFVFSLRDYWRS